LDRDRLAAGEDYSGTSTIRDERQLTVLGLRQDWSYQPSPSHYLKAGFDRAFSISDTGDVIYTPQLEEWLGILPSFGLSWRF
jgi:hypothetical protein